MKLQSRPFEDASAVVIGASLAGLATASLLSRYFGEVLVLEKDPEPAGPLARRGVPQGTHVHGLQGHALTLLESLLPGLRSSLAAAGAVSVDFGASVRAYLSDGWVPGRASGKRGLSLTRPLLEHHVRQHTLAIPNLQVRTSAKVSGLISNGDVVAGVVYQVDSGNTERYKAALVVDAGGRGSKAPAWLDAAGFGKVPRSKVFIDVRYVTCNFTRPPEDLSGFVVRHYPQDKLGAALLPVEDDQWLLSLSGRFGVYAETTLPGFLNSAQSLPISDVYDTIAGQAPTTPVTAYTFARNQFVHYDQLTRVPNGFVALGDSVLSLNPLYGQGMTSAFAQVSLLDETLATLASAGDPVTQTSARFLPQQAAFLDAPWARAMVGDTQFTETRGDLPEDLDLLRARDAALSTLAATDPEIARLLFQVNQFAEPASVLGRDDIEQKVQHILGPD